MDSIVIETKKQQLKFWAGFALCNYLPISLSGRKKTPGARLNSHLHEYPATSEGTWQCRCLTGGEILKKTILLALLRCAVTPPHPLWLRARRYRRSCTASITWGPRASRANSPLTKHTPRSTQKGCFSATLHIPNNRVQGVCSAQQCATPQTRGPSELPASLKCQRFLTVYQWVA